MKKIANFLSCLIIIMVAISFITVILSFFFNTVFIPLQELILYLHSIVFMLGIVYCLSENRHVRIDVFYQNMSFEGQKKVDLLGIIILLVPLMTFMFFMSWDYVLSSWAKLEGSSEVNGIPFIYGLKTLLLIMPLSILFFILTKLKVRK